MTSSDQDKNRPTAPTPGDADVDETLADDTVNSRIAPRSAALYPNAARRSEREEMAELMRSLRDAIPYQDEEKGHPARAATEESKDYDEKWEPDHSPSPKGPEVAPVTSASAGKDPHEPPPKEDDFARLLRSLRQSLPDNPELVPDAHKTAEPSDTVGDRSKAKFDETRVDETAGRSGLPIDRGRPKPALAAPILTAKTADATPVGPAPEEEEDATIRRHRPTEPRPSAGPEAQNFEAAPGDSGLFADLLSSLHDSTPRRSEIEVPPESIKEVTADRDRFRDLRARDLRATDPVVDDVAEAEAENEEEEPRSGWRVWKIALILGSAAALGLAIALLDPFDESSPPPSSQVVVPTAMPDTTKPKPPNQIAESAPVVVPVTSAPKVEPSPSLQHKLVESPPAPLATFQPAEPLSAPVSPRPIGELPPKPVPPPVAVLPPTPELPPVAVLPPAPEPPPAPAPPPVAALPPAPPKPTQPVEPAPALTQVAALPPADADPSPVPTTHTPRASTRTKPEAGPLKVVALPPPSATTSPPSGDEAAPDDHPSGPPVFTVQVGSFHIPGNADILIKSLKEKGFDAAYSKDWTDSEGHLWHVVRVGRLTSRAAANALLKQLNNRTKPGSESYILSVR